MALSSVCTVVFLSALISTTLSFPAGLGFDLSVGLQSSPLSASAISDITSGSLLSGVQYYKVNDLQNSDIAELVSEWDDLKSNIYCIALGNEPVLNNINFWVLPTNYRWSMIIWQRRV